MMAVGESRQEEIAKEVGLEQNSISVIINNIKNGILAEIDIAPSSFQYTNMWGI
jgi:hypothetical protein